jgi:hypothetical protein
MQKLKKKGWQVPFKSDHKMDFTKNYSLFRAMCFYFSQYQKIVGGEITIITKITEKQNK